MYFVILRQINAKFTFCAYHRSKNKEILLIPKNIVQTICLESMNCLGCHLQLKIKIKNTKNEKNNFLIIAHIFFEKLILIKQFLFH